MLERLAQDQAEQTTIAKINIVENPALARRFGIKSLPTFLYQ